MALDEEKTVPTSQSIEPEKPKRSGIKYCCAACSILLLLIIGGILLMLLFVERSCESNFKIPDIFKPSPTVPVPPGTWFPEDFSNLPEHVILERYRDSLNIGVAPDTKQDDLKKLNRYLAQTYFSGFTVFNVAYFNKDDTTELIAVYNYNQFTGTDNFTMMASEPGARFPAQ